MTDETMAIQTDEWDDIDLSDVPVEEDAPQTEETEAAPEAPPADQPEGGEGAAETEAETKEAPEQTDQFVLKHLDETRTVSRDEVVVLAQKGIDYDRIRGKYDEYAALGTTDELSKTAERLSFLSEFARDSGYKDIDGLIDSIQAGELAKKEGIDPAVALQRVTLQRRERELEAKEKKLTAEKTTVNAQEKAAQEAEEKRNRDFADFAKSPYNTTPGEIPKQVWEIYGSGEKGYTLVQAFQAYENSKLKLELAALKKSAENKEKAAGSRQGEGKSQPQDAFDRAWNDGT